MPRTRVLRDAYKMRPHRTLQNPRKKFRRGKSMPEIEREWRESKCPVFFYALVRPHIPEVLNLLGEETPHLH